MSAPMDAVITALSAEGVTLLLAMAPERRSRALEMAGEMIRTALDAVHDDPDVVGYQMTAPTPPPVVTALWERFMAEDEAVAEAAMHLAKAIGTVARERRATA